jgi:HPt (histidine-containing phosphotransfer) domain-containing protein
MADAEALERKLAALRDAFRDRLDGRMAEIEDAGRAVAEARSAADWGVVLGDLQALAHKLVGGAGTFGFDAVSDAARDLEEACEALVEVGGSPGPEARAKVDGLLETLARAVADGVDAGG